MAFLTNFGPLLAALLATGSLAGFLSGLLGIGGGIILVPCLYYIMTMLGYGGPELMHMAVGTSLAVIVPTGMSSVRAHRKRDGVRYDLLKKIAPGILIGVATGSFIADLLSGETLKMIFGVALIILALIMLTDPSRFSLGQNVPGQPWSSLAGFVIGTLSTLIGIGGATLSVPYMTLHSVPMHKAIGTAAALGLVISIPAAAAYMIMGHGAAAPLPFSIGHVNFLAWVLLMPVTIVMAPVGAAAAHRLPVKRLRVVFAAFMLAVAIRMLCEIRHV
jgi:uncharacterized protein